MKGKIIIGKDSDNDDIYIEQVWIVGAYHTEDEDHILRKNSVFVCDNWMCRKGLFAGTKEEALAAARNTYGFKEVKK